MIPALIGAVAGYKLGQKYLSGTSEVPVWTGNLGGDLSRPAISLTRLRYRGVTSYRVYVITNGNSVLVGAAPDWPRAVGIVQNWEGYLRDGGTVEGWLAHNTIRGREIADLEETWRD